MSEFREPPQQKPAVKMGKGALPEFREGREAPSVEDATALMPQGVVEEVRTKPVDHTGRVLSGVVSCSCGFETKHYALAADAWDEWDQHVADERKGYRYWPPTEEDQ